RPSRSCPKSACGGTPIRSNMSLPPPRAGHPDRWCCVDSRSLCLGSPSAPRLPTSLSEPSSPVASHAEIGRQLLLIRLHRRVGDHVDYPAVLHHEMAVRNGGGEAEVLLHQQDGEALLAQRAYGIANELHDDGREPLCGLVEQQELGAGAQNSRD